MKAVSSATLLVAAAFIGGCAQMPTSPVAPPTAAAAPTSAPAPTNAPQPAPAPAPRPAPAAAADAEVVQLPFELVVDPKIAKDISDKRVEFDAHFGRVIEGTSDLPEQYRSGYVRFSLMGGPDQTVVARDAVIPIERSAVVTTLEPLTGVHVRATSVPEIKHLGLAQRAEPNVVLVVDSVVPR
jgi:hypothetical protein